jgi:hypothetical protein
LRACRIQQRERHDCSSGEGVHCDRGVGVSLYVHICSLIRDLKYKDQGIKLYKIGKKMINYEVKEKEKKDRQPTHHPPRMYVQ